MNTSVQINATA